MTDPIYLYKKIKEQRKNIKAPMDVLYTNTYKDKETRKLQILMSLVLSPQTRDEITHSTLLSLNKNLPELGNSKKELTIENINLSSIAHINELVKKVGFYRKKSVYIKQIGEMLKDKPIPETFEEIINLPGVGEKIAFLYLQHACDKVEGIAVDTHVHRISNRIGMVKTKYPEKTRKELEKIFPYEEWEFVNHVFVGFGQRICSSVKPKCKECIVKHECPYSKYKF